MTTLGIRSGWVVNTLEELPDPDANCVECSRPARFHFTGLRVNEDGNRYREHVYRCGAHGYDWLGGTMPGWVQRVEQRRLRSNP